MSARWRLSVNCIDKNTEYEVLYKIGYILSPKLATEEYGLAFKLGYILLLTVAGL
jgi:hypothetical protein